VGDFANNRPVAGGLPRSHCARRAHLLGRRASLLSSRVGALLLVLGLALSRAPAGRIGSDDVLGTLSGAPPLSASLDGGCFGAAGMRGGRGRTRTGRAGRDPRAVTDNVVVHRSATSTGVARPCPGTASPSSLPSTDWSGGPQHRAHSWTRRGRPGGRCCERRSNASREPTRTRKHDPTGSRRERTWKHDLAEGVYTPARPRNVATSVLGRRTHTSVSVLARLLIPAHPPPAALAMWRNVGNVCFMLLPKCSWSRLARRPRQSIDRHLTASTLCPTRRRSLPATAPAALDEATPGFTPPRMLVADAACSTPPVPRHASEEVPAASARDHRAILPWQDARPPSSVPGERNSWLYIPLLHAGAGTLTPRAQQAWRAWPTLGTRFAELQLLLSGSQPVAPICIARSLLAIAECEAHDARREIGESDRTTAEALVGLPAAPLPLTAAVLMCMGPDGYLTAAAQSALLEAYAGTTAAAAARTLADRAEQTSRASAHPRPEEDAAELAADTTRTPPAATTLTRAVSPAAQLRLSHRAPLLAPQCLASPKHPGPPLTLWTWRKSCDALCQQCRTCRPS